MCNGSNRAFCTFILVWMDTYILCVVDSNGSRDLMLVSAFLHVSIDLCMYLCT